MAVVIACIALAIAVTVVFVGWALMRRNRDVLLADVRNEVDVAGKMFALQVEQLKVSRLNYDAAVEDYRKMRERAQAHFLTADNDANRNDQRLDELERYTKRTLELHATTGAKPLILRGGLYVQQLAVLDIVLELVDKFLVAVGVDLMYRQDDGPDGSTFYLRWPLDKAPRDLLDSLTRAAHRGSDDSAPSTGTVELRAVLDALRDGGLGVLYLGPLILLSTKTCIQAGFLLPGFHCLTEPQKRNAVNGTPPNLIADLGVAVFLEFKQ
ncbi:MAG TPA: hypothetical protein VH520_06725 [Streptosporangiaceae bacterium]